MIRSKTVGINTGSVRLRATATQSGLGLIEIMIGLALTGILLAGLVELFVGNSKNAAATGNLARIEETGRIAMQILTTDIRRAGHYGGNAYVTNIPGTLGESTVAKACEGNSTAWGRMLGQPMLGINDGVTDTETTSYACIDGDDYIRGDVITMRFTEAWPADPNDLSDTGLYLRTSLVEGRLFVGADVDNVSNELPDPTAEVYPMAAHSYFVGKVAGRSCQGAEIPSLMRVSLSGTGTPETKELLTGIEHMQFRYKVGDRYFNAEGVSDWASVLAVEVSLLVRSDCPEAGFVDSREYELGDVDDYKPNDSYRRRLFTSVVALRNGEILIQ